MSGIIKTVAFGGIIAMVACFYGLRTTGGTVGVGRSATQSVVMSCILILAADLIITSTLVAIFGSGTRMTDETSEPRRCAGCAARRPVAVELRDVRMAFGGKVVHDGVNLSVREGEIMTLVGGSGQGKTVLLKEIIGLMRPDSGEIFVHGREVTSLSEFELQDIRREVAMVFQGSALFDSMTVADNVAYGVLERFPDMPEDQLAEIVAEKLGLVDLPGTESLMPAELSGGMKKRVALARALALEPKIILYDEPTTGLDPANVRRISALIARDAAGARRHEHHGHARPPVRRGRHRPPGHARPGPHHRRRDLEGDGSVPAPARGPVPRGRSGELIFRSPRRHGVHGAARRKTPFEILRKSLGVRVEQALIFVLRASSCIPCLRVEPNVSKELLRCHENSTVRSAPASSWSPAA